MFLFCCLLCVARCLFVAVCRLCLRLFVVCGVLRGVACRALLVVRCWLFVACCLVVVACRLLMFVSRCGALCIVFLFFRCSF